VIIFYSAAVAFVVLALILRGRILNLASIELRHLWLIWAALVAQVLIMTVIPNLGQTTDVTVHYLTYVAGGLFAWFNRKVPGAWPIFAGGAANLTAIAANGGTMPASMHALLVSGWRPPPGRFANSAAVPHAHLQFLGDIFATPSWMPGHDVFSMGDIYIVGGIVLVIWRACTRPSPTTDVVEQVPAGIVSRSNLEPSSAAA